MRSELYKNSLSILEFVEIVGLNPYLVGQVQYIDIDTQEHVSQTQRNLKSVCTDCWFEYLHQFSTSARYDVENAIEKAVKKFRNVFGFNPAAEWETFEINPKWKTNTFMQKCKSNCGGTQKKISLPLKKLISLGQPYLVDHATDVAVVRTDSDADGIDEACTISVTVPDDIEPNQIKVYYAKSDIQGMIKGKNQLQWEIRPLIYGESTDNGDGTQTLEVYFYVYQAVAPRIMVNERPRCTNTEVPDDFIALVDVKLQYYNLCKQGEFVCSTQVCQRSLVPFCGEIENSESSIIIPTPATLVYEDEENPDPQECTLEVATCYATCHPCATGCTGNPRVPKTVFVHALTGTPREDDGRMNHMNAQIISFLAASYMKCKPCGCGCNCAEGQLGWYSEVYHEIVKDTVIIPDDSETLNNPFGATNGGVKAWKLAKENGYVARGGRFFLGGGK